MVTSIVYTLIGLILCFVLYIAFRAINTGMEAKKANKDLENSKNVDLANQEDLVEKLTELKELHEKKILSDEEFAAAKKKILGE
jgi:ABC-type lipoprotein release transport system permease subunit